MSRRREPGITLDEKHGVNPSLMQCFFCMEPMGLVLFGRMKGGGEAPREVCLNHEPCDKCAGYMKEGIVLISASEEKGTSENPWRTGGWIVIKEEALRRIIVQEELIETIARKRFAFVDDATWDLVGFPRGEPIEPDDE